LFPQFPAARLIIECGTVLKENEISPLNFKNNMDKILKLNPKQLVGKQAMINLLV